MKKIKNVRGGYLVLTMAVEIRDDVPQEMLIEDGVPMRQVSDLYFLEDGRYYVNERSAGSTWNLRRFTGIITTQEPGSIGDYYRKELVDGVEHGRYNVFKRNGKLIEVASWVNGKRHGRTFILYDISTRHYMEFDMGKFIGEQKY